MNYNFHCYNFNRAFIFLIKITLKTLILLAKITYWLLTVEK